jgi:hypothetical protein
MLHRRDLNRMAAAALGGLLSGAFTGCGGGGDKDKDADLDEKRLLQDVHVCRGLNTCKNKGKPGTTNDCAGQGHCAIAAAHDCTGANTCKGQGGCGEHPGENACKGKGSCGVPLTTKPPKNTWAKARKRFEEVMTAAKKKFGDAPES